MFRKKRDVKCLSDALEAFQKTTVNLYATVAPSDYGTVRDGNYGTATSLYPTKVEANNE